MTTKEILLNLSLPSDLPDLTCPDGEVESFSNVPWLQALADAAASKPGSSASQPNSILSPDLIPTGVLLPADATLLAIHDPITAGSDDPSVSPVFANSRFLIHTSQDALAIYSPAKSLIYLHASVSLLAGKILRALVFSDFILLITPKGPKWIVYNPSDDSYTLAADNPAPPQVNFNLSPVAIEGYSLIVGQKPELEVAVDIPETLNVSESMFAQWLDNGSGTAVKEEAKQLVYAAVGRSVVEFESMIRARGLYLTSPRCVASLTAFKDTDAVLPTPQTLPAILSSAEYAPPVARLLSWGFHAGTLRLKVQFSLVPMRLSASFSISESQRIWMRQFRQLLFSATDSPRWHDKGLYLSASSLTSWTDPSTGNRNGYAFRFADALSVDQLTIRSQRLSDFRILQRAPVDDALSGMVIISGLNYNSQSQAANIYQPDYRDFTIPTAVDGIPTDRGFALIGSSSPNTLLASHSKYPFIFRHSAEIGDSPIRALFRSSTSSGRTPAARHPLYALSADGIRHIESAADGEFLPTRLISQIPILPRSPIAQAPDRIFFLTPQGLATLTLAGAVSSESDSGPIEMRTLASQSSEEAASVLQSAEGDCGPIEMRTLPSGSALTYCAQASTEGLHEALLLTSPGQTLLYDLNQKTLLPQPSLSVHSVLLHNSLPLALLPDGDLSFISLRQSAEGDCGPIEMRTSASQNSQPPQSSQSSQLSSQSSLITRPMKLGNPFAGKRILSVQAAHPGIAVDLQASDDLIDWHPLASLTPGQSALRGRLHLIPARFFRLTLSCPAPLSPLLPKVLIRYKL